MAGRNFWMRSSWNELDHVQRPVLADDFAVRLADVASGLRARAGTRQHGGDEFGRGRLAVGAGDTNNRRGRTLVGQLNFRDDRHAAPEEVLHQHAFRVDPRTEHGQVVRRVGFLGRLAGEDLQP